MKKLTIAMSVKATGQCRPMDTSHAIILAAIIIVGGLWGGKLVYDYVQEQRLKAELHEAAIYLQESFKQASTPLRQAQVRVPIAEITRSEPVAKKDWDKIVEEVASRSGGAEKSTNTEKQTVFNDLNYAPQSAINIIQAPNLYTEEKPALKPKRQKEIVVVGKESRLRDWCPYKEGSVERRNCRASIDLNGGR
jgi:hypothetical protein